jgi:Coenzyme PQQ synthesis protein D (PqqD)
VSSGSQISTERNVFARSENVVAREIAGETLVIPVRGAVGDLASIYSFNATGTTIWRSLDPPKSFDQIVDAVMEEYNVSQIEAVEDVRGFLEEMRAAGLVICEQKPAQNQVVENER